MTVNHDIRIEPIHEINASFRHAADSFRVENAANWIPMKLVPTCTTTVGFEVTERSLPATLQARLLNDGSRACLTLRNFQF